jgi:hypothetical protein
MLLPSSMDALGEGDKVMLAGTANVVVVTGLDPLHPDKSSKAPATQPARTAKVKELHLPIDPPRPMKRV